jgi:hypothetical protein
VLGLEALGSAIDVAGEVPVGSPARTPGAEASLRRSSRAAAVSAVLLASAAVLPPGGPAHAQTPPPAKDPAGRDSLPTDSVLVDSVRCVRTRYQGQHGLQGVLYALLAGRLTHPHPALAGGVTLGYRAVRGPRAHDGLEVAFPFVGGGLRGWVRAEAAYVVSLKQSSWNYRLQGERLLGRWPVFAGFCVDLKAWEIRRRGKLSHGTLAVLLGRTYRR